ncbi:MAG: recombinase family protein [Trichodesmium sp.]
MIGNSHTNQVDQNSVDNILKPQKQRALELYESGLKYKEIAEKLKDEGYRNRKNNPYSHNSIRKWVKDINH